VTRRRLRPHAAAPEELRAGFDAVRRELDVPTAFPPAAAAAAQAAAQRGPADLGERLDARDLDFVTLDPLGSMDLDQAFHLERRDGGGWRVRYAIADVAAFVAAGDPVDAEAWVRGSTRYAPDGRAPLHPPVLSEGAASLLPDQDRPAVLWTVDLGADGERTAVDLRRAWVRSRAQLDYVGAQRAVDDGSATGALALLAEVGAARSGAIRRHGGFDLPLPDQEVVPAGDGWTLELRAPLAVERHNAQLSLLCGLAAADLMLGLGAGLLRTLPPPEPAAVERLRAVAAGLGVAWPAGAPLGDVLDGLDAGAPAAAAFVEETTTLLRGAAYVAFDGPPPAQPVHGAIGAPYAHVTAPLRRLCDRFTTEVCLAACTGGAVPDWAREALPRLPEAMTGAARRDGALERACVDFLEAVLLRDRVGETFAATVVDVGDRGKATVTIREPPVRAPCDGDDLQPGSVRDVTLATADPATRKVRFAAVGAVG
jgi:exoribonuclease R